MMYKPYICYGSYSTALVAPQPGGGN
ncbi:hypothetical protein A2U01_0117355, partial [Trifolium medium]|nr:hypothetical protein [Trifolium medium]